METLFEAKGGLHLRKTGQDDKDFAYRVKRAAFKAYVEQVWGWDEATQRKFHDRRFETQDFFVIESNGTDVGVLSMSVEPDCVHVHELYVLPEHQGQGVGGESMSIVIEAGNELGLPLRLRVLRVNPRAAAFYRRLGFAITGRTDTHVMMQRAPDSVPSWKAARRLRHPTSETCT